MSLDKKKYDLSGLDNAPDAEPKEQVNLRDRSQADRQKDNEEMMRAVMKKEKEGWTHISDKVVQYVRPTGYGMVTLVRGEWKWVADRNGQPRREGSRALLESAMKDVQEVIN